jgi:hypothetical protein
MFRLVRLLMGIEGFSILEPVTLKIQVTVSF